ncbi:MAG: DUF1932 domain-containing protein [Alphaproteobacteria bacterium]
MTDSHTPRRIALLSPGIMGAAVGAALVRAGLGVTTCLAGRSAASRARAESGGLALADDLAGLLAGADLVLSVVPPAAALATAEAVAAAMTAGGGPRQRPAYADLNAVSPATARRIAAVIAAAGAPFIDGGIVGGPPAAGSAGPRIYVSGAATGAMGALDGMGFAVMDLGPEVGRASALKMVYAALTKGTNSLHTAVMLAAEQLAVTEPLVAELAHSQAAALASLDGAIPRLPADAGRWIGEMEEIAATFRAAGVTGDFHDGAAWVFQRLAESPYGEETRETMDHGRSRAETVRIVAGALQRPAKGEMS